MKVISLSLSLACSLLACADKEPGALLARGQGRGLIAAAGGQRVAFLIDARHPDDRSVPDDLFLGDLYAGSPGQPAKKVGAGVSSGPGGYAFSAGGQALALLAAYRFRDGAGELWLATDAGARKLADDATSFAWAPKGERLAFVARGKLSVLDGPAAQPREALSGAQSFLWAPDGERLAARGPRSADGTLWLLDAAGGQPRALGGAADYAFGPDGTLAFLGAATAAGGDLPVSTLAPAKGSEVARAAAVGGISFSLSAQGGLLVLSTAKRAGEATGELLFVPPGKEARKIGDKVSDYRFTPAGEPIFLASYDVRARTGALMRAPADGAGPAVAVAPRAQAFTLDRAGKRAFWLVPRSTKGDFKIELWTADLGAAGEPRKIDEGVYGYEPSPDGKLLYWKARCGYGPRSCSLFRAPLDGSAAPAELAKNVAGFDLSDDGKRLLLAAPHRGSGRAVDLSWLPSDAAPAAEPHAIAPDVDPSAKLLDAAGTRAVFAVQTPGKAAVYTAELK